MKAKPINKIFLCPSYQTLALSLFMTLNLHWNVSLILNLLGFWLCLCWTESLINDFSFFLTSKFIFLILFCIKQKSSIIEWFSNILRGAGDLAAGNHMWPCCRWPWPQYRGQGGSKCISWYYPLCSPAIYFAFLSFFFFLVMHFG